MKTLLLFACLCIFNISAFAKPPPGYYSQHGQDKYVHETFFQDKDDGIFVEIGAYDGITISNTYFFEKQLGWEGICIEPHPDSFQALKANCNCICIKGAIGGVRGVAEFCAIIGGPMVLSGIVSHYDPRHVERINREVRESNSTTKLIEVEVYPLVDLLNAYGIYHIDFLSIDTEGGELEILKAIDFNSVAIEVITVENNYGTPDIESFLTFIGYTKVKVLGCDELYDLN